MFNHSTQEQHCGTMAACRQWSVQFLDSEKPKSKYIKATALTFSPCSLETCLLSFASHLFPRIIFSTSGEACWDKHRPETRAWLSWINIVRQMRHPLSTQHRDASPENLHRFPGSPNPSSQHVTCTMAVLGSVVAEGNRHIRCSQKYRGYRPHNKSLSGQGILEAVTDFHPTYLPSTLQHMTKCNASQAIKLQLLLEEEMAPLTVSNK